MKKLLSFLLILIMLCLCLSSVACKGSQILSFSAFNTDIRIEARDKNISSYTKEKLQQLFSSLENQFDTSDSSSLVYQLNSSSKNTPVLLNATSREVLSLAKEYYLFSEGNFNPAVYPLVKLWQFENFSSVVSFTPPTDSQINQALEKVNFDAVTISQNHAQKSDDNVTIDLGGLVKGYALDKALEIMKDAGHSSGYISIGSSSIALLNVQSLNVSHPRKNGQNILSVNTSNKYNVTLSTSGDYERFFEYNGKKYSHVIDPKTGYPIETGIASATIIGATGSFTDALTTALCVCSHSPTDCENSSLVAMMRKIIASYPESEIYVVYQYGEYKQIITNKEQGQNFTLLDNQYTIVNI